MFDACPDRLVKKQMGFVLARLLISIEFEDDVEMKEIIGNAHLSRRFLGMAKELDVVAVKVPEDVYKSHLESML